MSTVIIITPPTTKPGGGTLDDDSFAADVESYEQAHELLNQAEADGAKVKIVEA